jgi:uncharacterized membrane protein
MAKKTTTTTRKKTTTTGKKATSSTRKTTPSTTARDAEQNKGMSIIAYIGILCLIPLLTGDYKKSTFLKFHTNQGVVLFITAIAVWFASWIIGWILSALLYRLYLGILAALIGFIFGPVVGILILILAILGIINAVNGRMKPLPIIGKFEIIK